MKFILRMIPQFRDGSVNVKVEHSTLTINDNALDFSPMSPGDVLPLGSIDQDIIVSDVVCDANGDINMALVYPCVHGDMEGVLTLEDGQFVSYSAPLPVIKSEDEVNE